MAREAASFSEQLKKAEKDLRALAAAAEVGAGLGRESVGCAPAPGCAHCRSVDSWELARRRGAGAGSGGGVRQCWHALLAVEGVRPS